MDSIAPRDLTQGESPVDASGRKGVRPKQFQCSGKHLTLQVGVSEPDGRWVFILWNRAVCAADMDEAVSSFRPAGEADIRGTGVQDERATWRPLNDRSLDQLCHCDADSKRPTAAALDCSWRGLAVSARQLTTDHSTAVWSYSFQHISCLIIIIIIITSL